MTTAKLSIRQVSRRFGGMMALAPTDLDIAPGEFVCVMGPSGCGKSTLFHLISGVLPVDSGAIFIVTHDNDEAIYLADPVVVVTPRRASSKARRWSRRYWRRSP